MLDMNLMHSHEQYASCGTSPHEFLWDNAHLSHSSSICEGLVCHGVALALQFLSCIVPLRDVHQLFVFRFSPSLSSKLYTRDLFKHVYSEKNIRTGHLCLASSMHTHNMYETVGK